MINVLLAVLCAIALIFYSIGLAAQDQDQNSPAFSAPDPASNTTSASGFVDEMTIVSTKIRTFDNQRIVVPSSKIWGDVITNVSVFKRRRADLVFGISYSDNAAHAIEVLQQLIKEHALCLDDPAAEVFVGSLGDSSVNIYCRLWCKSEDYWNVCWDLTGQAKERFDEEGISIPFPQRDVHLIQALGGDRGELISPKATEANLVS